MNKLLAVSFVIIILVSNISFSIGKHYCGGEPVETRIMIIDTHLGCDMEGDNGDCDVDQENSLKFQSRPCCENDVNTFLAERLFFSDVSQSGVNIDFTAAIILSTKGSELSLKTNGSYYPCYSPPFLIKDDRVLFQTFLI